ncbi:MAG: hypothetical protein ACRESA_03935 [Gammaproteobacteria bacterium]
MHQRVQDLRLRAAWGGLAELGVALAQLAALSGCMALFAAVVILFG